MIDVGFAGAFLGGVLSLLSPCAALLLPSFFAYAFDSFGRLFRRTGVFYLGMAFVLVPLGAGVGAVGSLFTVHRETVTLIAGSVIVILGVVIAFGGGLGGTRLPAAARGTGVLNVLVLGAAYGFAGFCSGPLLGAILTVALTGGSAVYGGALMAVYGLGMAAPLLVLAAVWDRFDMSWLRGRRLGPFNVVSLVSGAVMVAVGVLMIATDGTTGIPSLTTVDQQFDIQRWLTGINDLWLLLGALVIVALVLLYLLVRRPAEKK